MHEKKNHRNLGENTLDKSHLNNKSCKFIESIPFKCKEHYYLKCIKKPKNIVNKAEKVEIRKKRIAFLVMPWYNTVKRITYVCKARCICEDHYFC